MPTAHNAIPMRPFDCRNSRFSVPDSPDELTAPPAPADENNVDIKSNDSESADMEEPAQDETPAHFPLSTQEQLQAMARRREAALSFKQQIGECRLALKYSVIGWTGTLNPVSIGSASCYSSSSSPSHTMPSLPSRPPIHQVTYLVSSETNDTSSHR